MNSMKEYDEARRLGRVGYDVFEELGLRWGMGASLCRIGFAEIGLANFTEATNSFHEALMQAMKAQKTPLVLY